MRQRRSEQLGSLSANNDGLKVENQQLQHQIAQIATQNRDLVTENQQLKEELQALKQQLLAVKGSVSIGALIHSVRFSLMPCTCKAFILIGACQLTRLFKEPSSK